jgi:FKBP-type peptidyl-prolyl cis-trans isomerase SlyD
LTAIAKDRVVSLAIELYDGEGALIQSTEEPLTYLHGGYGGLLAALERALEGHRPGEAVKVHLEPEHAFGEYDAELLRVEPRSRYGDGLALGMEVEDAFDGADSRSYIVTDLADDKVVLDGNHPLAGMALNFSCKVISVRAASAAEVERGDAER